jgi:hypothetical protein
MVRLSLVQLQEQLTPQLHRWVNMCQPIAGTCDIFLFKKERRGALFLLENFS